MDIAEGIAIILLIVAVLVLVYYYIQSNPKALDNIRRHVPTNGDADINDFFKADNSEEKVGIIDNEDNHEGVGKKIKVKLSDIDMSNFNTDMFSKKIDAFLDHKSDELIKEWSLVTTDDLSELESKFEKTTTRVDTLDDDFKKFKSNTESKLSEIDKRIKDLENN